MKTTIVKSHYIDFFFILTHLTSVRPTDHNYHFSTDKVVVLIGKFYCMYLLKKYIVWNYMIQHYCELQTNAGYYSLSDS